MAQGAQKTEPPPKVLVIGLDGATFDFITPWVEDGSLPFLAKLINQGVSGPLVSTVPSVTPPAWTSMFTGTNPGKHGIFHFHDVYAMPQKSIIVNATHRRSPILWEILTEVGKSSILLNVPMTYPPNQIKGIVISGFLTPPTTRDFVYPTSLRSQISKMNYQIGPIFGADKHPTYKKMEKHIRNRTRMAKWLMDNHEWDFLCVVYMASDGVVHRYPGHLKIIKYVYERLDAAIKELVESSPPNTVVIITSDHGIGLLSKQLMINNWLKNSDLQAFRRRETGRSTKLTTKLLNKILQFKLLKSVLHRLPLRFRRMGLKTVVPTHLDIDPNNSVAWGVAATRNFALLGLNVAEDEKQLIETLQTQLSQIQDPETGQQVVQKVHRTRELLSGPALDGAPQAIMETVEDYGIKCGFTHDRVVLHHSPKPLAAHTRNGIFIAAGPEITSQGPTAFQPQIWDVMPTVLHILNVAPPLELDGRVLLEIFEPGSILTQRKLKPVSYRIQQRARKELTSDEQKKITERLEQLGYI